MATFLVTFYDKGKCDITDITVDSHHIIFAASLAHHKIILRDGPAKVDEINRDTDSVTVEKLT